MKNDQRNTVQYIIVTILSIKNSDTKVFTGLFCRHKSFIEADEIKDL